MFCIVIKALLFAFRFARQFDDFQDIILRRNVTPAQEPTNGSLCSLCRALVLWLALHIFATQCWWVPRRFLSCLVSQTFFTQYQPCSVLSSHFYKKKSIICNALPYRRTFFYNIWFISISDTVSGGASKIAVLNVESVPKEQLSRLYGILMCHAALLPPRILQFLKANISSGRFIQKAKHFTNY